MIPQPQSKPRIRADDCGASEHLSAVSDGLKRKVKTPSEYRDRMRLAVRLVCRSAAC